MPNKHRLFLLIPIILLVTLLIMASTAGWRGPLSQMGMDTPTATLQPGTMVSTGTPTSQATAVPTVNPPEANAPSPTMTSIFTGFTPPPTGMPAVGSSMGGCGSSCGMGSASGMGGSMSMGTTITGTVGTAGMAGMGNMGAAGMDMSGCPMMSGSAMSGSGMSMMGAGDDLMISGMDMSESTNLVADESSIDAANPWTILGWVVLGLVSLAVIVAVIFGIVLLVRQLQQAPPA